MKKKIINALVGYTGFIGSNLKHVKKNFHYFNSKNIHKIRNKSFNTIYCAGTYSKIWLAKKEPGKDKKNIRKLIFNLSKVKAKKFFLISTCEVYGKQKKTFENSKIVANSDYAYGYNRMKLEQFVKKNFKSYHILRLPIVYGKNFSKNFLYDLINRKNLDQLNGNDKVQIYEVSNLAKDLTYLERKKITELNISSKPFKIEYIAKKFFKINLNKNRNYRNINIKSLYGKYDKYYFMSQNKTLSDLKKFLNKC